MKKTLKRLPILLAFVCTLFLSACSEIDVNPKGGEGDDDEEPIILKPAGATAAPADTVSIG